MSENITYGVLRIDLATPILFPSNRPWEGIHLDGVLGRLWAIDNGLFKTPAENDPANIRFPELPLLQIAHQVYAASTMFIPDMEDLADIQSNSARPIPVSAYPEIIVKSTNWTRSMREQVRLGMKDFTPDLSSGRFRACMESYWTLTTPFVYFYFATQEYDKLKQYFERIPKECFGLGAKTRSGYGLIKSIAYNILDKEDCYYVELNGLPTRPVPVSAPEFKGKFPDTCIGYASYRCPYFSAHTKADCYLPPAAQYLPQFLEKTPALDNLLDAAGLTRKKIYDTIQKKAQKKTARKA